MLVFQWQNADKTLLSKGYFKGLKKVGYGLRGAFLEA